MDFENGISLSAASWSAGAWYILAGSIAIFCGSFVAGRLSENVTSFAGVVNGLLVWALFSLSAIYVITSAQSKRWQPRIQV